MDTGVLIWSTWVSNYGQGVLLWSCPQKRVIKYGYGLIGFAFATYGIKKNSVHIKVFFKHDN